MDKKKLQPQLESPADGGMSAGETTTLTKDEQHLAKLGYKQGLLVTDMRGLSLNQRRCH